MVRLKGPALAGLFFALHAAPGPAAVRLPENAQVYFRQFLEHLAPLVMRLEKKSQNYRWGDKNRDCAGLVRYLFWEALQEHNDTFFRLYPETRAVYRPESDAFSSVARIWSKENFTATQLIAHARFISRSLRPAQLATGDLLYFSDAALGIRHVMLVIRRGRDVFLIYHTGDARQELRIRTLDDLQNLAESEWHADPANPVFRGLYRPDFLN